MQKRRARMVVEWDLDPVPGFNDTPEDMGQTVRSYLEKSIPHYNPTVEVSDATYLVDHAKDEQS